MPNSPAWLCAATSVYEESQTEERLIHETVVRMSEVIAALSVALDITEGQPAGHAMRSAMIGMRLADEVRLSSSDRSALFYALLLKDLGCSSNAAKMAYLFGADDHLLKRDSKDINWRQAATKFKYVWRHCSPGGSVVEKLLRLAALARSGPRGERKIVEIRCERGAEIARRLLLPETTATAILALDEHWDGGGHPRQLRHEQIPLLGRICCLSQTVEVFCAKYGPPAAIEIAAERRGTWFDPQLVNALKSFRSDEDFWKRLRSPQLAEEIDLCEPEDSILMTDEEGLDRVAEAFAQVIDAKSPWTYRHSAGVADISVGIAQQFGCTTDVLRDIRRAALLHDLGKLGVSNMILDKPSTPTAAEFEQIRRHPALSQSILQNVAAFDKLADVASAHHERLDGRGYHRRIDGSTMHWASRVLAVADVCEALSAKRPYRDGLPWERVHAILQADAGPGVDPECLAALVCWHERNGLNSRVEVQLQEVDRLIGELA